MKALQQHPPALAAGTAGRIVELLRRGPLTIDQIAGAVGLTRTAVRAQLATLLRNGTIEERGLQRGISKPSRLYGLRAEAEVRMSRLYVPLLSQLLHVLAEQSSRRQFDAIMRQVGRGLMTGRAMPHGALKERVRAASALLNELGGATEVDDERGRFVIRGHGCPLGAVTAQYPEACNALESLLSEFVGDRVVKCCDLYGRRDCCFEVAKRQRSVSP